MSRRAHNRWTEAKLYALLEKKFSMPGYAVFRQVPNHPTVPSRYADDLEDATR